MAIRNESVLERARRETEALRRIPLDVVIRSLWSDAKIESQGSSTYWHTPEGKIETKPDSRGSDLYRIWSGPHAKPGGMGAINFLRDVGVCVNFDEAKRYLMHLDPLRVAQAVQVRKASQPQTASQSDKPFRLPLRMLDRAENLKRVTDYLVGVRKLSRELIEALATRQDRSSPFYAGYGRWADYIVFPCRDHAPATSSQLNASSPSASLPPPTGAILRWRHTDRTPPAELYGGRTSPMSAGSNRSAGWWQMGQGHDILIVTEAPIDGLTVAAALLDTREYAAQASFLATGGTGGLNARQFVGYDTIMVATDADREGDRIADDVVPLTRPGQTIVRVRPLMGHKDWNAAWQVDSESVKRAWHEAFQGLERGQEMER